MPLFGKLCPAYRDVKRSRSNSVHIKTKGGRDRPAIERFIAASSPIVPCIDEDGHALRRRLLISPLKKSVACRPQKSFAQAETAADDRSHAMVNDVGQGQVSSIGSEG